MRELSQKQRLILEFSKDFVARRGYPPSIRDIVSGCGLSSTSVAEYNLRILEREGHIRRDREVSRGIELLGGRPPLVRVPLVGVIAAGTPIPVPGSEGWGLEVEEYLELPRELAGGRELYALRVKGTSMLDALINDGDIVILEHDGPVEEGDTVAVWLKEEKEVTLKRLYREGSRVRLQPANSQMSPLYVDPAKLEIQGKVVTVLRRLT